MDKMKPKIKKVNKVPKLTLLYIKWKDAATEAGWMDIYNPNIGTEVVYSGGLLLKDTKKEIVITNGMSSGECVGYLAIPKPWIISTKKFLIDINKD